MRVWMLVATGLVATAGCGKAKRPGEQPVYPVTGKVTFKGESMPFATVTFYPAGRPFATALKSRAVAEKDGVYQLTTYEKNDGAPAGAYAVVLYVPLKEPEPYALEGENVPDRLKHTYIDPAKSKLRFTVKPEPNTIDINLP